MADGGLSRREVLLAGAAFLVGPAYASETTDNRELDTAIQDRHEMLVDALLAEDLDVLIEATREELDELGKDEDLVAVVPDCKHILYTAGWWGYMRKTAIRGGRPFELPQVVRTNLHWKTPIEPDPYAHTYGII